MCPASYKVSREPAVLRGIDVADFNRPEELKRTKKSALEKNREMK